MNSIKLALHTAGVPIPALAKRIWLWVNDHPGKTSKDIAAALGEPPARVASRLSEMKARQMVAFTYDMVHSNKGRSSVMRYTVTQKAFELLPLPRKAKPLHKPLPAPAPTPVSILHPGTVLTTDKPTPPPVLVTKRQDIHIDDLTVREARVLYEQLHKMFGGES